MDFDCKKVLTPFTKDKEKWLGWKGYFSDYFIQLKEKVETNALPDELTDVSEPNFPYERNGRNYYMYFYPVEEPEPKQEWRPYESLFEMACDISGCSQVSDDMISVASFLIGKQLTAGNTTYAISAIDYNLDTVLMHDQWFSMERLFQDGWKWIDAQESVARRCGIREEVE